MPVSHNARLGQDVSIDQPDLVNLNGCRIGDSTHIAPFVEIQKSNVTGTRCKISSRPFICEGIAIEGEVMIAVGVMFINDLVPCATRVDAIPQTGADRAVFPSLVRRRASIGSNATPLAGFTTGQSAMVGAGGVVTANVADDAIVAGASARVIGDTSRFEPQLNAWERSA